MRRPKFQSRLRQKPGKKNRRLQFLVLVALLAFLWLYVGGAKGLYQQVRLRLERRKLQKEITALKVRQLELQAEVHRLETDSTYLERLAREKYRLAKPGEKIYLLVPGEKR